MYVVVVVVTNVWRTDAHTEFGIAGRQKRRSKDDDEPDGLMLAAISVH